LAERANLIQQNQWDIAFNQIPVQRFWFDLCRDFDDNIVRC
jgi:hypothetical protein